MRKTTKDTKVTKSRFFESFVLFVVVFLREASYLSVFNPCSIRG